jgi:hypothetical protein
VKAQALGVGHLALLGDRVVLVDLGEEAEDLLASMREVLRLIDELPAAVGQTVRQDRLEVLAEFVKLFETDFRPS